MNLVETLRPISTKEKMPGNMRNVFVWTGDSWYRAYHRGDTWLVMRWGANEHVPNAVIKYWMEMPGHPEL